MQMFTTLRVFLLGLACALLSGCASAPISQKALAGEASCYDRERGPQTAVVDAHLHFRPFGGRALPFAEVLSYLERSGVRFVTIMGIGQTLPADSSCTNNLSCPGTPVAPSMANDLANAAAHAASEQHSVHMTLSMTFPDLARPETILPGIRRLDAEFPGRFGWMGEVNLVKQALFGNGHEAVSTAAIDAWADFMAELRARDIPLSIHADLGSDANPTEYLPLFERVLKTYPDNRIIWMHMGLSRELTRMDPRRHVALLTLLLDRYPSLMLDLSWRVIDDHYFSDPDIRRVYIPFLNAYSTRMLPGTDFMASSRKNFEKYREDLRLTSRIYGYLNDTAFRNIALGQNYSDLLGLGYQAPPVCNSDSKD